MINRMLRALGVLAVSLCWAGGALAQDYPSKSVRIVIGFGPGSGTDIVARLVAEELRQALNQPFVVVNKPGANAQLSAEMVAQSAPDGYTLLLTSSSSHSVGPHVFRKLPYDPIKDFTPIGRVCDFPLLLVVDPKLPIKAPQDLVTYARANPGKVSFAYPGRPAQIAGASMNNVLKLGLTLVPYTSSPPAMQDIAAGRVSAMITDFASSQGLVQAGSLRAVAVTTAERTALAPHLPPLGPELGLDGFDLRAWTGIFGPAKLPKDITDKLSGALVKILGRPEFRERLVASGMEPTPQEAGTFAAFVKEQLEIWGQKVKAAGIEPE